MPTTKGTGYERYPKRDKHVAPPPPHRGWLASGKTYVKWDAEDGQTILRVRCEHKRRGQGSFAEAVCRGSREWLVQVEREANLVPCKWTRCPRWERLLREDELEHRRDEPAGAADAAPPRGVEDRQEAQGGGHPGA